VSTVDPPPRFRGQPVIVHFIGPIPDARIVHAGVTAYVEQLDADGGSLEDLFDGLPEVVSRYGLVARLVGVSLDHLDYDVSRR
jgi:hypothetical protein